MIVWTNHPKAFPICSPDLVIDYKLGHYWRDNHGHYRDVLPKLHRLLGETQFLWCVTTLNKPFQRMSEDIDLVRWELDVPSSQVLALYREDAWNALFNGESTDWRSLIVDAVGERIGAFVRVPIEPAWATRQEIPVRYPKRQTSS